MPAANRPVLLIHGQPGRAGDWDSVIASIAGRVQTLAVTRPGWSPGTAPRGLEGNAAAVLDELDRAGMDRAVIAGHSLGGAVATWLAASHPDRVAGLVLVSPAANVASLTTLDRVLAAPALGDLLGVGGLALAGAALSTPPVDRELGARLGVGPSYLRSSGRVLLRPAAWRSFTAEQRTLVRELPELERRLPEVSAPTTIVAGTADRIVPIASARHLAQQIQGAELVELEGAHHLLHQQRPAELAEIIVRVADRAQ